MAGRDFFSSPSTPTDFPLTNIITAVSLWYGASGLSYFIYFWSNSELGQS